MLAAVAGDGGRPSPLEQATGARLHVRGHEVTVDGGDADLVERLLRQIYGLARAGRPVRPDDVPRAVAMLRQDPNVRLSDVFAEDVLVRPRNGRPVSPRSVTQKRYVAAIREHALTFGVGPAGTGKTFLAVAMAVHHLLAEKVRRIVISRPAIEAGEQLGFLPGTLEEKVSPYLRPIYDALYAMLDPPRVMRMLEQQVIEIAPLAYMRGRTLEDAFVILDEAQNTTREQMKMFLTRIGQGTRCVVTGDPSQVDLPGAQRSGLADALDVLAGIEGIAVVRFTGADVMRHPLVQRIVEAYESSGGGTAGA
ncbi:MAG: PhoH family protein [Deltaproteobacteria bacterium]|nr:MAG: PhoH family protein [Deltaproteobacteria bacterium]